jgi:hypothetical protein
LTDLWRCCVREASTAAVVLLYAEPGETMKGALVEVGAALSAGVPVVVVGDPPGTWGYHPLIIRVGDLDKALIGIRSILGI